MGVAVPCPGRAHIHATLADNREETYTLWHLSSRSGVAGGPYDQEGNANEHTFTPLKTTWTGQLQSEHEPLLIVHFVRGSRYEPLRRGEVPVEVFSPGRRLRRSERRRLPE